MYKGVGKPTEDLTMKKIWKNEEGVSPVIAVILMVAITVVLAAVLYVMVSGMMTGTTTAPTGAFSFTESTSNPGNYTGTLISISTETKFTDASLTIIDDSSGNSGSQDPIDSGTPVLTTGGAGQLTLTYTDTNDNNKLDAGDVWKVANGGTGDNIKLIHKTGKSIAEVTLD
jgi:flagellin-like protein